MNQKEFKWFYRNVGSLIFLLLAIYMLATLAACASVSQIWGTLSGQYYEQATKTPYWIYAADLDLTLDGQSFHGVATTLASNQTDIGIKSMIGIDRVEVETCDRMDVCQNGTSCNSNFAMNQTGGVVAAIKDWFGQADKTMTYHFKPSAIEAEGNCNLFIRVYNKAALFAWGFVAFRDGETLPSTLTCNAQVYHKAGHSACNPKAGKLNIVAFDVPIKSYRAGPMCHMVQLNDRTFQFTPEMGLCVANFSDGERRHGLDVIGYQEVLVRGGAN